MKKQIEIKSLVPPHKSRAEIFKAKNGQFSFRFIHKNGNKLLSSETYTRKANAIKACKNLIEVIANRQIEIIDLTKKK